MQLSSDSIGRIYENMKQAFRLIQQTYTISFLTKRVCTHSLSLSLSFSFSFLFKQLEFIKYQKFKYCQYFSKLLSKKIIIGN